MNVMKNVKISSIFYKERKRTPRLERSFIKNAKIVQFFYKKRKRPQRSERFIEKNGCPTLGLLQAWICLILCYLKAACLSSKYTVAQDAIQIIPVKRRATVLPKRKGLMGIIDFYSTIFLSATLLYYIVQIL